MQKPAPKKQKHKPRTRRPNPTPINQRLALRIGEYALLTGRSHTSVWRAIKSGDIPTVKQGNNKLIPRSYLLKVGFISE